MAIIVEHPLGTLTFPEGTTEAEINRSLVQLEAEYGDEYGLGETLGRSFERGISATARGAEQLSGVDVPLTDFGTEEDLRREFQRRVMQEQSPVTSFVGEIGGAIADPVTLPTKVAKVPMTVMGLLSGGAYGALEPTYEELEDSRVANTLFGTGIGGALGGTLDLAKRFLNRTDLADEASEQSAEAVGEAIDNVQKAAIRSEVDDDLEVVQEAVQETVEETPTPVPAPEPIKLTEVEPVNFELPPVLKRQQPKLMGARVDFENDIDMALYKIGSGAKGTDDLVNWTSRILKVDEDTVKSMAKRYRADTMSAGKKQAIDASVAKTKLGTIKAPVSPSYQALVDQAQKKVERINEQERAQANFLQQLQRQKATKTVDLAQLAQDIKAAGAPVQSMGAMKTDPLRIPADRVSDATVQKVMETPEAPTPRGQASATLRTELDEFVNKFIPALSKGRYVAKGRQARQGKGTMDALGRAGTKRAAQIAREAGSVSEYFTALKATDAKNLDPEDIVASTSVQQEIDNIIEETHDYYTRMIDQYGSVENMPADIQRDVLENILPALLTKQVISGSLTRASDMMNAQRLVNSIRRRENAVKELLGQRCY